MLIKDIYNKLKNNYQFRIQKSNITTTNIVLVYKAKPIWKCGTQDWNIWSGYTFEPNVEYVEDYIVARAKEFWMKQEYLKWGIQDSLEDMDLDLITILFYCIENGKLDLLEVEIVEADLHQEEYDKDIWTFEKHNHIFTSKNLPIEVLKQEHSKGRALYLDNKRIVLFNKKTREWEKTWRTKQVIEGVLNTICRFRKGNKWVEPTRVVNYYDDIFGNKEENNE